ncbi:MAG: peroxiredoxin-like family protein [Gammaproteobacteria bacterium]|nr:peroxiredoxin-like family protein [Gammaproteobacteria bacterium]MDP7094338.1 peroxiredoxin-like family protein [Gammaproteobacteria bacterium]MDP7270374.1 peroxiredoxin-like family protein [Gammaproteobacteria bacterium]HJP03439.1 peroxiredoxin-like family protein [Gammaproteobacteria bacterium]
MKRLIYPCVAVYGILFFASVVGMGVPDDANDIEPLTVGQSAPRFTAHHTDGRPYVFDPGTLEKPVVLITYRGGWCPYCNMHLKELRDAEPRLLEMGLEVIFLSTDRPEILYASLFDWVSDINYTLLSDSKMDASKALGIAFRMEESEYERLKSLGIDMEKTTGETHHMLPGPAVFIIDTGGVIRFVYTNPDYKIRLEAGRILAAAQDMID